MRGQTSLTEVEMNDQMVRDLCHFLTTSCTFNLHVSHGFQGGRHLVVCYATEMGKDAVWQKCIGLCNMRVRT